METRSATGRHSDQRRERMTGWSLIGASEYKHVVLSPIFINDVEDAIDQRRAVLRDEAPPPTGHQPRGRGAPRVPRRMHLLRACSGWTPEARWQYLNERAMDPRSGQAHR